MQRIASVWAALWLACVASQAAQPGLFAPLAISVSPPCSSRHGVRTVRSNLVQFKTVTASLTAQSSEDNSICNQSVALWVTQNETSQQIDLGGSSSTTFAIVDIAPDTSGILVASWATSMDLMADRRAAFAFISLIDGAVKWNALAKLVNEKDCSAGLVPQGFLDSKHFIVAANCHSPANLYSVNLDSLSASPLAGSLTINRFAQVLSGPVRSCRTDPDVVGACYQTRARLAEGTDSTNKALWPVGSKHVLSVENSAIPTVLSSAVSPDTRVYATMTICPVTTDHPGSRRAVCIESASDLKTEAISKTQGGR